MEKKISRAPVIITTLISFLLLCGAGIGIFVGYCFLIMGMGSLFSQDYPVVSLGVYGLYEDENPEEYMGYLELYTVEDPGVSSILLMQEGDILPVYTGVGIYFPNAQNDFERIDTYDIFTDSKFDDTTRVYTIELTHSPFYYYQLYFSTINPSYTEGPRFVTTNPNLPSNLSSTYLSNLSIVDVLN